MAEIKIIRVRLMNSRTIVIEDNNIESLRQRYPEGLHFVVGDLHGEVLTLVKLMDKIRFDPDKDHIYFVGDYNGGGDTQTLLKYMSNYYQEDHEVPGFHMIRGNHERELSPFFELGNLPDIMVVRTDHLNYYIVHAGMVSAAFDLINRDMEDEPGRKVYAYRLENNTCCYDAPLRQIIWSLHGLYSQRSRWHVWPSENKLMEHRAVIVHGHSPYSFFRKDAWNSYGDNNLFWEKQHMYFCEELHSFNVDSDIKGRNANGERYRGLSCICLEVYDEIASDDNGLLTIDKITGYENGVFAAELDRSYRNVPLGDKNVILDARPQMKTITLDESGRPVLFMT